MQKLITPIPSDAWVTASWDDYIQIVSNPIYEKAKCYYHKGQLRIEMSPVGFAHAADNTIDFLLLFREQGTLNREQRHLLYLGRPQDRNGLGTERRIEALSFKNKDFLTFAGGLIISFSVSNFLYLKYI
jgi:hypothetical protein